MTYREIITKVAKENKLTIKFVDRVYRSYWRAVREYICSLPLREELTDEEFLQLRPNVNIPSIGKLYITPERYRRMKTMFKIKKEQNDTH